jgi:hypothetical protein
MDADTDLNKEEGDMKENVFVQRTKFEMLNHVSSIFNFNHEELEIHLNNILIFSSYLIKTTASPLRRWAVSQYETIQLFLCIGFMDFGCWQGSLRKIFTSFSILISGLCTFHHNLNVQFSCYLPFT